MTNTERDEVKKIIYRVKPEATLLYIKTNGIHYRAQLEFPPRWVFFKVPLEDLGEAEWLATMPAQLLLRYLID